MRKLRNILTTLICLKPAEIAFKNAIEIDQNFVNAHYGIAVAYLYQNKTEVALVELQKVIELAPDSLEAKNAQGIIQQIAQKKLKAQPEKTGN
jgi:Tfp pilus assembly protein PilF